MRQRFAERERVTDLRQIRENDVIVVQGCRRCGKDHQHVVGPSPRAGVFFTSGTFHESATGALDLAPALKEHRVFRPEPGTLLEMRMRADLPD